MTKLTRNQTKDYSKEIRYEGMNCTIYATVRHDDRCGNGHNTLSITGDIYKGTGKSDRAHLCGGCIHDDIAKHFPELRSMLKWHLTSTDGPMHYVANTMYHAESGKLEYARSSAVWPTATLAQLRDKRLLIDRLPKLMKEFRADVESMGFTY